MKKQLKLPNGFGSITRYIDIDKNKTMYPKKPFNVRQLNRVKALITEDNP